MKSAEKISVDFIFAKGSVRLSKNLDEHYSCFEVGESQEIPDFYFKKIVTICYCILASLVLKFPMSVRCART